MDFLKKYGIEINNKKLLMIALTHSSYANEKHLEHYERLEYLGDSVLQLIISEYLYNQKDLKEGQMSKIRASYVCEEALNVYAKDVGYEKCIKVGNGLHGIPNNTIIADVFEAILAVIYLDQGFEVCKKYIYDVVVPHIKKQESLFLDYKTIFQELIQTSQKSVVYDIETVSEDSNNPLFKASAKVNDIILGVGIGKTKKEAEQNAAKDALKKSAR